MYYFRLEFWNFHRYSNSFKLKKIPDLETQKIMIWLYMQSEEIKELLEKYGLTWFELEELN